MYKFIKNDFLTQIVFIIVIAVISRIGYSLYNDKIFWACIGIGIFTSFLMKIEMLCQEIRDNLIKNSSLFS